MIHMKIRNGFVSNSSSSSWILAVKDDDVRTVVLDFFKRKPSLLEKYKKDNAGEDFVEELTPEYIADVFSSPDNIRMINEEKLPGIIDVVSDVASEKYGKETAELIKNLWRNGYDVYELVFMTDIMPNNLLDMFNLDVLEQLDDEKMQVRYLAYER